MSYQSRVIKAVLNNLIRYFINCELLLVNLCLSWTLGCFQADGINVSLLSSNTKILTAARRAW